MVAHHGGGGGLDAWSLAGGGVTGTGRRTIVPLSGTLRTHAPFSPLGMRARGRIARLDWTRFPDTPQHNTTTRYLRQHVHARRAPPLPIALKV